MTAAPTARVGATASSRVTARGTWRSRPCDAMGHRFCVTSDSTDPELLMRLAAVTAPLTNGSAAPPVRYEIHLDGGTRNALRYSLSCNGRAICHRCDGGLTVRFLAWDVNQRAVDVARRDHTVLHAAAASRDPHTVVLAAPREHGKTTLVAGLLAADWDYVTDEAVAVRRDDLRIRPFPKALSMDPGSWPLFPRARPHWPDAERDRQWQVPARALGARHAAIPGPPTLVVLPRFEAGAQTRVVALHPAVAVTRLARCTFGFPAGGPADLAVLVQLARSCPTYELTVGDLTGGVRAVDALAAAGTP